MSSMKIGLGMYPGLLTTENFRFAQQVGATHIVAHLPGFARRLYQIDLICQARSDLISPSTP